MYTQLKQSQNVSIEIFDVTGALIKTLANTQLQQGAHQFIWNAAAGKNNIISAGVYFLKIQTGDHIETRKLILKK